MGTIIFIALVLVILGAVLYNNLQKYAQAVRRQASNVQVAISKKLSLINQLIDAVKNYQEGEQLVQLKVSQDNTASAMLNAYQQSGNTLASIQGMMERFPNLKANEQYKMLMTDIKQCELDIQSQRTYYNNEVERYNNCRLKIPTVFIARLLGFSEAPYLEFDHSGLKDVTSLKEFKTDDGERLTQLLSNAGSSISKATKNIAGHASHAGKLIVDKVKDQASAKYFYMIPGGAPKGPISREELETLHSTNNLPEDTTVNKSGTDEWIPMKDLLMTPVTNSNGYSTEEL